MSAEIAAMLEEVHAAPPIAGPYPHAGFGPGACRGCVVLLVRAAEAARDARWRVIYDEAQSALVYAEKDLRDALQAGAARQIQIVLEWLDDKEEALGLGSVATAPTAPSSASGALAGAEDLTQETNPGAATRGSSNLPRPLSEREE